MRTAIIYRSFLGATRQYAEWLHESIESSDLFKPWQARDKKLAAYDLVILCSGTYIGWISLRGYLKKKWPVLKGKKVLLLVVGLVPPEDAESTAAYEKIPENIRQEIWYYKVPGRWGSRNSDAVKKENLQPVLDYIRKITG
jgi:menaquinone-dependent protoporphyrinogen IX oxidase